MLSSNVGEGEETVFLALLCAILAGHKPVEELLECPAFRRRLLALCIHFIRDGWDADELYDDICIKVCDVLLRRFKPDFGKPYGNFFAWLGRVAYRKFLDRVRPARREFTFDDIEVLADVVSTFDIEERYLWDQRARIIREAIRLLPDKRREAVSLYLLEGYSFWEAAKILTERGKKCSHSSVRNWVQQFLQSLFPETNDLPLTEPLRKPNARARRPKSKKESAESDKREKSPARVEVKRTTAKA